MPIKTTRTMLSAALDGTLNNAEFRTDENFGFDVPISIEGVTNSILTPRSTWAHASEYDIQARKLVNMFISNFSKYGPHVSTQLRASGPKLP